MSQIVFGVGENKICVSDSIVFVSTPCFSAGRYPRSPLGSLDSGLASCKANKTLIKTIEPRAQFLRAVPCRISCNKDQLDLIPKARGHLLKARSDVRHVERTLIGATGISEKEERDVSLRLPPEIKRSTGGIGQSKSRLRQGWGHQGAPVCCFRANRVGRVRLPFLPPHNGHARTRQKGKDDEGT